MIARAWILLALAFYQGSELPSVLSRRPSELPRAGEGRWRGFFADDLGPVGSRLSPETLEGLDRAEASHRAKDYPRALGELFLLLEREPDLPPALLILGTTYFRLRRYGDGALAYERFLAVAPGEAWRTQALAHCYLSLGDYERAREHYLRVLSGLPASVEALRGLAIAEHRLGDDGRALELLGEVVRLAPRHEDAEVWIARILRQNGRGQEGLEHSLRALASAPRAPEAWYEHLLLLEELGGDEERSRRCEEIWKRLEQADEAFANADADLRVAPNRPDFLRRALELASDCGDVAAAEELARRLLEQVSFDSREEELSWVTARVRSAREREAEILLLVRTVARVEPHSRR